MSSFLSINTHTMSKSVVGEEKRVYKDRSRSAQQKSITFYVVQCSQCGAKVLAKKHNLEKVLNRACRSCK